MLLPWVYVFALDLMWLQINPSTDIEHVAPPFYHAVSIGLLDIVKIFLDTGVDVHALNGLYGFALQAASYHGDKKLVQALLNAGVGAKAGSPYLSLALQAASEAG